MRRLKSRFPTLQLYARDRLLILLSSSFFLPLSLSVRFFGEKKSPLKNKKHRSTERPLFPVLADPVGHSLLLKGARNVEMAEWKREIVGTRSPSDVNEDVVRRAMIKYIWEKINDWSGPRKSREERIDGTREQGGPITAVSSIRLASISTRFPDLIEVRRATDANLAATRAQKMSRKLLRPGPPRRERIPLRI